LTPAPPGRTIAADRIVRRSSSDLRRPYPHLCGVWLRVHLQRRRPAVPHRARVPGPQALPFLSPGPARRWRWRWRWLWRRRRRRVRRRPAPDVRRRLRQLRLSVPGPLRAPPGQARLLHRLLLQAAGPPGPLARPNAGDHTGERLLHTNPGPRAVPRDWLPLGLATAQQLRRDASERGWAGGEASSECAP
jgi:hypothetical protein